mgnify:CR=1 FL=1
MTSYEDIEYTGCNDTKLSQKPFDAFKNVLEVIEKNSEVLRLIKEELKKQG